MADQQRHLAWEAFASRIGRGVPSVERIAGEPRVDAFIDLRGSRIGVRVFQDTTALPASPLAQVEIRTGAAEGASWVEVSTSNQTLYRDFYAFSCAVADRVQLGGLGVAAAITDTLAAWTALLRHGAVFSVERQVGLIGELWFLSKVAGYIGWRQAVDAWQGPGAEEHDFVLPGADVEVKATLKEDRVHQIGSLQQLEPKAGRALYLASVQLTSGTRASGGMSLTDWVDRTRADVARAEAQCAALLSSRLRAAGWDESSAAMYTSVYRLRTEPVLVPVDDACPSITRGLLAPMGRDRLSRIDRVSYAVDLGGLGIAHDSPDCRRALVGN